jgi:hypothetical protein
VLAAAYDEKIRSVAAEEMLTTWIFNEEFRDIGLAYFIPRILTLGDMPQWIACLAPRPVLLVNPVDGRRRGVAVDEVLNQSIFARAVFERFHAKDHFQQIEAKTPNAWLEQWSQMGD